MKTIKSASIYWDIIPGTQWDGYLNAYCSDGDGVVQVYEYADSRFEVSNQGEAQGTHSNLHAALKHASEILKYDYTEIYDSICI